MKEYASSSVSLFQSTRGSTIIPSHALWLLLFSCYHDQNHTHYVVEVIEVVVGGRDAADEVTAAEAVADATYLQQVLSLPPLPPSFSPLCPGRIPPGCVLPPS